jgi:hypothetical protein
MLDGWQPYTIQAYAPYTNGTKSLAGVLADFHILDDAAVSSEFVLEFSEPVLKDTSPRGIYSSAEAEQYVFYCAAVLQSVQNEVVRGWKIVTSEQSGSISRSRSRRHYASTSVAGTVRISM